MLVTSPLSRFLRVGVYQDSSIVAADLRPKEVSHVAKIGYFLSCEEWGPKELIEQARMAEEAGFEGLWISDHYHPWTDEQGNSPFVWAMIGASPRRPRSRSPPG